MKMHHKSTYNSAPEHELIVDRSSNRGLPAVGLHLRNEPGNGMAECLKNNNAADPTVDQVKRVE